MIYITGVSGTGKSTILHELRRRGFEAYGVDEHGFAERRADQENKVIYLVSIQMKWQRS